MIRRLAIAGAGTLFACGPAFGQGVPKEMAWTACNAGSSGFNIAATLSQQVEPVNGWDVRIPRSGNDTGRLAPQAPIEMSSYAYPIFMTFSDCTADTISGITKAMIDTNNGHMGGATGVEGTALSRPDFRQVVPYHGGAIRTFKDEGVWSEVARKHHDGLIKRQQVLIDTWKRFNSTGPIDDTAFAKGWTKARAAAPQKAGMEAVLE